jgi:hypothetical protein
MAPLHIHVEDPELPFQKPGMMYQRLDEKRIVCPTAAAAQRLLL